MVRVDFISNISSGSGVYLMKSADGRILYVGKARNLKKRLNSYFKRSKKLDIKTRALVNHIADIETIVTSTEKEAFLLESTLIKRHRPKYNVSFKDDKRYPLLKLDIDKPFPILSVVRKIGNDQAIYFGPFVSSHAVNQTLKFIHKTFKLRKCKTREFKTRTRPCLNYQIDSCMAPCCNDIDPAGYHEIVKEVILFLRGKTSVLINKIMEEMMSAAGEQDFEKAALLRDRIFAIEKTVEKQNAVTQDLKDRDVIAMSRSVKISLITILSVRGGYLLGSRHFNFQSTLSTDHELLGAFIRQHYENAPFVPEEILVQHNPEDARIIEEVFSRTNKKKVRIVCPQRGEKVRLIKIASANAETRLKEKLASASMEMDIAVRIQKKIKLNKIPLHIECIDNSNISGKSPVSGLVVFKHGKPDKSSYRRYILKDIEVPDDYANMAEVLKRRFKKNNKLLPYPDLLMVDGGKGQINIAVSILKELKLNDKFGIIGIAKKDKKKRGDER